MKKRKMASLQRLASQQIPLMTIWNQDLLNTSLQPEVIQTLKERFTLEDLLKEKLLDETLDLALFGYILEKEGLDKFLIPYILNENAVETDSVILLNDEREKEFEVGSVFQANRIYYRDNVIKNDEYGERLEIALGEFLEDLLIFLENSGRIITNNQEILISSRNNLEEDVNVTYIWDRRDNEYRLFFINDLGSNNDFSQEESSLESLDELLRIILHRYIVISRLVDKIIAPTTFSPKIQHGLECLIDDSHVLSSYWQELLSYYGIKIIRPFQMAPRSFVDGHHIQRIGNYLYLIGDDILEYYREEDANLFLNLLDINEDCWVFT